MADISSITSGIANSGGTSVQSQDKELGKEEFLTLMVEQLKNQDPMNPQDATEFTSQLAQYTSLEQLININSSIEDMGSGTAEMQRLSALSMIGTEVVSKGSEFTFTGEPTKLGYNMDEEAEQGVLYIRDNSGNTVAAKPLTQTSEGQHMLEWDGVGDSGNQLPQGKYSVAVSAFNGEDPVAAHPLVQSRVVGVDMEEGNDMIVTDSGKFKLAEVESVRGF